MHTGIPALGPMHMQPPGGEVDVAPSQEYDRWAKKHPDDAIMMGGFLFFRYLQNERSDLLDFRAVGDKWQIVHGWLRDWVKD